MAEGEGGGKGKLVKIILAVVVLLLLVGGGVGAWMWLSQGDELEVPEASQAAAEIRTGGGSIENPQYLELGNFVVNLADGRRYLKTNLSLLLSEELAKEYLSIRVVEVKDLVVAELQTLNAEQLRDGKHRTLLKKRLLAKIKSLLPNPKDVEWDDPDPVKKVLITEFYLQ